MALGNLLNSLGAKADANLISQIGGLTDQGISFYGLTQAASYYGINLTGLHLDAGQLKPNDIVLLNINGNNHYALILGKLGDNYIIQDPFLGTVIMNSEQFNKYYAGNALTMNPNGRGTPLSIDEMKNLFGGVYGQEGGIIPTIEGIVTFLTGAGVATLPEGVGVGILAIAGIIAGGVAIYKANEYYSQKYPELNKPLPSNVHIGTQIGMKIGAGIAFDIGYWLDDPKTRYDLTQQDIYDSMWQNGLNTISASNDPPKGWGEIVARLIEETKNAPLYQKIIAGGIIGMGLNMFAYPIYAPLISPVINTIQSAREKINKNLIQPALDRFNQERAELVQKGAVKYAQTKYTQAKTYVKEKAYYVKKVYDTHVKPLVQKYVKPSVHRILDPVWNHPATQWAVKNVPGFKRATDGLGWFGNKIGIW
ncbi:MAG: hypothetical protein HZC47_02940 [Methanobacterium sp.]|nr:hypothetical protein [Methanobacterium sp.]